MLRRKTVTALAALALTGCAVMPTALLIEEEHVSHPLAGWPVGPASEEDALEQTNLLLEWTSPTTYVIVGVGYKHGDMGFRGPRLTGTLRAGYRIPLRRK